MKILISVSISVIIISFLLMIRDYQELHKNDHIEIFFPLSNISNCYSGNEKPYAFCTNGKYRKFLPDNSEIWEDL